MKRQVSRYSPSLKKQTRHWTYHAGFIIAFLLLATGLFLVVHKTSPQTLPQVSMKLPAVMSASPSPVMKLADNQYTSLKIDLNNDGVIDNITLKGNTLSVNNTMVDLPGHNPEGYFGLFDFDGTSAHQTSAAKQFIAVTDLGANSNLSTYTTTFYGYDGKKLYSIGTVPGLMDSPPLNSTDNFAYISGSNPDGTISTPGVGKIFDTWFYQDEYKLVGNVLKNTPQDFYPQMKPQDQKLTLLGALKLQRSPLNSETAATLSKGDVVTMVGCDNIAWCKVQTSGSVNGWFNVSTSAGLFDGLTTAN